ncbi:hypothetical protein GRI97_15190 [Altererythrobacter xixiisoli]|uniref:Phage shock protein A (PspA) family protein n=1 Tax=Croceibacterium xixiisoli TaxID=1476466 RepID=A0A6I4TWG8_9SPHN|nr:PspA/IM30 family protein [Croceibacterium xixiisoli]MXP00335.1 hypothetical protein [Croceibacterium xixiisoli]
MRQTTSRISDLLSSNGSAIDRAMDPVKMLDLLHAELQDHSVKARAELARALRDRKSRESLASACEDLARDWHAKANIALAHQREDLARAALSERERALAVAAEARQVAQQATEEAGDIVRTLEELASRLTDTATRIAEARANTAAKTSAAIAAAARNKARRIDTLEQRLESAAARNNQSAPHDVAALLRAFEQLQHDANVEEELEAMKARSSTEPESGTRE